jgi:glutamate synthase (NADPH/NADH) large chain
VRRHALPMATTRSTSNMLDVGGIYGYRLRGEEHAWTPANIAQLQHAVRGNVPKNTRNSRQTINEQSERMLTIRGLMELK